ncbi:trypsin-3-like [Anoplophora glabripennis]|uniref:trypsin-3-like n=1 Tax=Anoplophora glabripennis TaxID=217634 RepID=UPI0008740495|nr:trypsin-3-like [Anoplophora glabripennis]
MYDNGSIKLTESEKHRAQLGQFPWMVRLGAMDMDAGKLVFYCGGSLVSRQIVVSAAHCGKLSEVARIGENNIDENVDCEECICAPPPQDIEIKKHIHADHCRLSNKNDIIVLGLAKPATFNDFVRPICLPEKLLTPGEAKKQPMIMSGWGVVYSGFGNVYVNDFASDKNLRYVKSPILDEKHCNKVYDKKLEENQYCVGYPEGVDKPCAGDSGGPLILHRNVKGVNRAFLMGVASHDLLMCELGEMSPVVYTNVGSFTKWMKKVIIDWMNEIKTKGR